MKATVKITIDFEVRMERRWFLLRRLMYATAVYEGEMELGDIRVGEILSLNVFNDIPTQFVIRNIQRTPVPGSSEVKSFIEIYERTKSTEFGFGRLRYHTLEESINRLSVSIANRLAPYGLVLNPAESKVGREPRYQYVPSNVSATETTVVIYSARY